MKPYDDAGRVQLVIYGSGLGSDDIPLLSSKVLNAVQGATGLGLAQKVKEMYLGILLNYRPGDKISLLGFSRGSYTARTVVRGHRTEALTHSG